ncbi:amino acid permease 6 [Actinidia rufa]|uniref:Amino acid permease 6 n=1 Tax=Actinidia rufa TaxID=165716 RepID=A0A7J0FCS1_9ERIC|nr:amino acid permease 6 [Actinidia rufa]
MFIEQEAKNLDDDGRPKRTGTFVTASAHIITAVIGSGVLSLAWAIAQLGWVAGPAVLLAFSFITYFTSTLLADSYRSPDPITGRRNYTYMDVVRAHLGGIKVQLCGLAQYGNLIGVTIGYTITASISMVAVKRSNCFHKHGHHAKCSISNYPFMIIFATIQIILSQIPNFHKLSWLSILAAIMSFTYSSIGLGLAIAKVAGGGHARTSLTGETVGVDVSASEKDTLRSHPPENKVMKKASLMGVSTTTLFYVLCGCVGYAAFGNKAPGNFLTGFGFYEPFWLIDFANVCIAVHLIGAYQVFCQPIFGFLPYQLLPASVANRLRNSDSRDRDDLPFLQRLPRVDWGSIVLSSNSVFPHRNAHRAVKNAQVFLHLDMAEDPELGLPDRVAHCRCRIHSGASYRPQNIQALRNSRLNCSILFN